MVNKSTYNESDVTSIMPGMRFDDFPNNFQKNIPIKVVFVHLQLFLLL